MSGARDGGGFLRPGAKSAGAFGVSFERNKPNGAGHAVGPDVHAASIAGHAGHAPHAAHATLLGAQTAAPLAASTRGLSDLPPGPGDHLPVARYRDKILYALEQHAVLVLMGETGSGKTTQVPKYLMAAGWADASYMIAVTQPRRAAAATVAHRVAEELGVELGGAVGYTVRFDACETPGVTRIKYLTDGVLIREMLSDPLLSRYSVIMVDEAHERSLSTDMLLGLLKKIRRRRPELRLIISSATLQAETLAEFFSGSGLPRAVAWPQPGEVRALPPPRTDPAVMSVEGRTYPVDVYYLQDPAADYVRCAVTTCVDIHKQDMPGDVLIFLTGQEEVTAAVRMLDDEATRLAKSPAYGLKMLPLPLYSGLPGMEQARALAPAPRGMRKVVVATNIAETSLTLEGVVYVVDSCFAKQRCYNPLLGLEALLVAPTSKASATQRAGRAGRVRVGKCYRLTTEEAFEAELPATTVPEMQRSDLTGMVMQLKALGVDNVMGFEWLAPPPAETMVRALETLHALGALDDDAKLTASVGLPLAELPLEPPLGAFLLAACARGCGEEALTLCALLSVPHVWMGGRGSGRAVDEARAKFAAVEGDLVTLLNVWRAWHERGQDRRWAGRHYLSQPALLKAVDVRAQLLGICRRLGLDVASCRGDTETLRKAIVCGLFVNAACFDRTEYNPLSSEADPGVHVYRLVRPLPPGHGGARLRIHSSSVMFRVAAPCVVFHSVQQNDDGWYEMQAVTSVAPEWLIEAAPHMYERH